MRQRNEPHFEWKSLYMVFGLQALLAWGSRYSRHPNYFGESCLWWGIALLALAGGGAWWAFSSPVLVTFLLLKVSGVNLQEQHLQARGPAYVDYVRRTSAFLPSWPKAATAV